MRRTFAYEFRRNLLPLVIFCVVAAGISMAYTFTATLGHFNRFEEYYEFRPVDSAIGVFTAILCVLATIVPILQFSYRMKQRSADLWYSLPVSRTKLTLVRVLEGLVLVFVPYTLAYWLGVAGVALQGMEFTYIHYLSYYALSLPLGVGLFGALSFIFSRANTVADGIMFLILWACLFPLIILVCLCDVTLFEADIASELPEYLSRYSGLEVSGYFFPYSALAYTAGAFEAVSSDGLTGTTDAAVGNELPTDGWERIRVTLEALTAPAQAYVELVCNATGGTAWFACPQLETGEVMNAFNLVSNGDFRYTEVSGAQTLPLDWGQGAFHGPPGF